MTETKRKPGRPSKKVQSDQVEVVSAETVSTEVADVTEVTEPTMVRTRLTREEMNDRIETRKRVPLHEQREVLTTKKRPGWIRRIVNDVGDRIAKFELAGWRVVPDNDVQVGDLGVTRNMSLGTGARVNVGRTGYGMSTEAVLMEIPEELYNEDQRVKQRKLDETEQVIKRTLRKEDGFYGEISTGSELKKEKQ